MQTYSHSGIIPARGAIRVILVGLATSVLCGVAYGCGVHYAQAYFLFWPILLLIGAIVTGVILGETIKIEGRKGNVRNPRFMNTVVAIAIAATIWIYWGTSIWFADGQEEGLAAWTPRRIAIHAQELMTRGFGEDPEFSIEGWPVTIVWIVEGGLLFGTALLCARGDVRRPFCEQCLEWTNCKLDFMELAVAERHDSWPEGMNELVNESLASSSCETMRIDLATCPSCEKSNYISIYEMATLTDRGRSRLRTRLLIRNAILNTEQTQTMKHARTILSGYNEGTA